MAQATNKARFQAVIETAVDGIILIDARGTVLVFNPACEKLFGYSAAEVIGQTVKLLMSPPYRDEHDCGNPSSISVFARAALGSRRPHSPVESPAVC